MNPNYAFFIQKVRMLTESGYQKMQSILAINFDMIGRLYGGGNGKCPTSFPGLSIISQIRFCSIPKLKSHLQYLHILYDKLIG